MTLASEHRTKQHIEMALAEYHTRVAVLIVENIGRSLDLLEEQAPPIIDAVREHIEEKTRNDPKSIRHDLRAGMLRLCKHAAAEARKRERRLFHGITGLEEFGPCPEEPASPGPTDDDERKH